VSVGEEKKHFETPLGKKKHFEMKNRDFCAFVACMFFWRCLCMFFVISTRNYIGRSTFGVEVGV